MIWCVFHLCDYWPWLLWRALSYDLEGWRSLMVATQLAQQHCRGLFCGPLRVLFAILRDRAMIAQSEPDAPQTYAR